jgi:hypothetical protein
MNTTGDGSQVIVVSPNFDQQKEGGENSFYIPGLARL